MCLKQSVSTLGLRNILDGTILCCGGLFCDRSTYPLSTYRMLVAASPPAVTSNNVSRRG